MLKFKEELDFGVRLWEFRQENRSKVSILISKSIWAVKMIKCWVEIRRGLGLRKNNFRLDSNLERIREKSILILGLKCGPKFS